jgi:predicted phage terminase large subunit-like protein
MINATVYDRVTLDREWARRGLRYFVKMAWPWVQPETEYVHGWHIETLCAHLEAVTSGTLRRLVINVPPGHMKSLLVNVFWPAWTWTVKPHLRFMFASYGGDLAIRDSLAMRRLIDSPWYQRNWGDAFTIRADRDTQSRFETDKDGYRLATSVDGIATGEHADIQAADDPIKAGDVFHRARREEVKTWWDNTMATRLRKGGARVVVMQRLHEDDLAGHLLKRGDYEHLCLPEEFELPGCRTSLGLVDRRTKPGELLWPQMFPPEEHKRRVRELGSYGAAGQLQQRPSPLEGGFLKRAWWKFYRETPAKFDEVFQSWDLTFKGALTSDFVVGQVWGVRGAECYLLDRLRDRLDFPSSINAIRALSAKWPQATAKVVEDKANGPALIATLKGEVPGIVSFLPEGSKEARAHAVTPMIEAGNVYLPDPSIAPWVHDFVEECAAFPTGAHDDQVDAMTQALLRARARLAARRTITDLSFGNAGVRESPWRL